ncbi:MAG: hypothetical protein OXD43_13810, partial [Bacteroidetes bacterium]|nr:hypothetical protein [Bacteroidota bacterium]
KPFCEKTREIWVKTHEFGAKSALLDGKMGKMSTEISNSSNGVAKMGWHGEAFLRPSIFVRPRLECS